MQHRDFVYKWLFYAGATLLVLVIQSFLLVHIRLWGVHPFLPPVLAALVAVQEDGHESAVYAIALGVALDLTMAGPIPCFYTLACVTVMLLSRLAARKLFSSPLLAGMVCGLFALICTDVLQMLCLAGQLSGAVFRPGALLMGKELLITAPFLLLTYVPFSRIGKMFRQE